MSKWDYFVWYLDESVEAESMTSDLNDKGRDGWELVSVAPFESPNAGHKLVAFFRRAA